MSKAIAGGSARPSMDQSQNGKTVRGEDTEAGISIFDPTLCELAYTWFSKKESFILDPFAGGSVRGIVAAELGRNYVGIDLRAEQIEANKKQAETICKTIKPVWHTGNSKNVKQILGDKEQFDFIFSCPPYFDLEVYSDNPEDLSTMEWDQFLQDYWQIIKASCDLLKPNRFACFVVGEVRNKKGNYINLVGETVAGFEAAGMHFYNEAILVTSVGSLPIRAGRAFSATRKLGKTHQNVLVFVKGDGKKAAEYCGPVEVNLDAVGVSEGL
jgi:DNA modification methylase